MTRPGFVHATGLLLLSMGLSACTGGEEAPERTDILLQSSAISVRDIVPSGATLDALLRRHGLTAEAAMRVVSATAAVFDPRRLRASRPFMLARTDDGEPQYFEYEIDEDRVLQVALAGDNGALDAEVRPIPKSLAVASAAGRLSATAPSLFQAMEESGERPQLSIDLAQIFAGEIDFNSELQPDDRFAVSFERWIREDGAWTYGKILAAEFQNNGRTLRAIRFAPPGGEPSYYDEQGRSLRRFFLKSPLKFEPRITSRFQLNRRHPVLHVSRAHRGVDYGAPTGAPVVAVASGLVVSVSRDAANGRMVRLRHASGYETSYLHLSAFAPGLRRGDRVQQGELIGRVGSSGLATGPHLHYGLKKNGVYVDPVREHRNMPPGDPLPPDAMPMFAEVRDRSLVQLARAAERRQGQQTLAVNSPSLAP